ncbi:dentin sialophosphoprotein-like protein isoform X2 [Tasmannia lanceolata]|uniref:dentin sialophosphoprotein-like protein isoform X2 n=1 Tax=Tasmannia lanceolata TaxID=3420 RepID=UPI0040648C33
MYGGSGKMGRGGRGAKRMLHSPLPPAPPHRPAGGVSRPPIGAAGPAPRNRQSGGPGSGPGPAPSAHEETFSLVSTDPLAFGMIIRLTPDLVEEITRVEAQGGTAQIKFDSNPNNSSGNVIDVGGKDFRFTWSRELGDCDIYEERRSGEDGNGLLVESGSAWRKLNVHRILDESTKNHVKMRSEEAERLLKSRKAIVLDNGNPSMKNQMKALAAAAVDSNQRWIPFKKNKEAAFKKRKFEPSQVAITGPPKAVLKSGLSSTTTTKGRQLSVSPLPSPPEHSVASVSPFGIGNLSRINTSIDEVTPQVMSKENITNSEKEITKKAVGAAGHKGRVGTTPTDLRCTLITLLSENPKGKSLKALENAVGDTNPNSGKMIESIIKEIATLQAPGRYFLKPEVEMETFKKPSSESGSSPECAREQMPVTESTFLEKAPAEESDQQIQLSSGIGEESNLLEKIDTQQNSPNHFASDKKVSNNSEGRAGSSSESGSDSDSDSDSTNSGSDSGSQSRSPAGSGSGSSSDSESDGSSSSKEGSDVDVDIMTSDDEKDETDHKLQAPYSTPYDDGHEHNDVDEKCDDMVVGVEITEGSPIDDKIKMCENLETERAEITEFVLHETNTRPLEERLSSSPDKFKQSESQQVPHAVNATNDRAGKQSVTDRWTMAKHSSGHDHSDRMERNPKKSKRASDPKHFQGKSDSGKRLKAGSSEQDPYKDHSSIDNRDRNPDIDSRKGYGVAVPGRPMKSENIHRTQLGVDLQSPSVPEVQELVQRSGDISARGAERPGKYAKNLGRSNKHSERISVFPDESNGSVMKSFHLQEKFPVTGEDSYACEKSLTKNVREIVVGDKLSTYADSHYRKSGEESVKLKDGGQMTHLHSSTLPKENMLRRELSDLELGEFREPVTGEEIQGVKRQFERNSSFKSSENKSNASDNLNSDLSKGRSVGKTIQESKRQSPAHTKVGDQGNTEGLFRKRMLEDDVEDSTRPQQRGALSQAQQLQRVDRVDSEVSQLDKLGDTVSKGRKNDARASQGNGLESHASTHRKTTAIMIHQNDPKHSGQTVSSDSVKETKLQKSNTVTDLDERRNGSYWMGSNTNGGKRKESFSDEDDSVYSKYDKDEPELRGPIKDCSQYREYFREYHEKFEHYLSLDKKMEKCRVFDKLRCDIELTKGRDTEAFCKIGEQILEAYRQCIGRYKWMKKIFIVLHEELAVIKQRVKDFQQTYIGETHSGD